MAPISMVQEYDNNASRADGPFALQGSRALISSLLHGNHPPMTVATTSPIIWGIIVGIVLLAVYITSLAIGYKTSWSIQAMPSWNEGWIVAVQNDKCAVDGFDDSRSDFPASNIYSFRLAQGNNFYRFRVTTSRTRFSKPAAIDKPKSTPGGRSRIERGQKDAMLPSERIASGYRLRIHLSAPPLSTTLGKKHIKVRITARLVKCSRVDV